MDHDTPVAELDVLSDEEMERVVGGADPSNVNTQKIVYMLGGCGCGLRH